MTGQGPTLNGNILCGIDQALSQLMSLLLSFIVVVRFFFHPDDCLLARVRFNI